VKRSQLLVLVLAIAIVILPVYLCHRLLVAARAVAVEPPGQFCTFDDEIYQTFTKNVEEWMEIFRARQGSLEPGAEEIWFTISNGKQYYVSARFWELGDHGAVELSPKLHIPVVIWSWQGPLGAAGYFYSPLGQLISTGRDYTFERFAGDIYCYRMR
jgi:hypothetical protein